MVRFPTFPPVADGAAESEEAENSYNVKGRKVLRSKTAKV
jgi:hypothetical protein